MEIQGILKNLREKINLTQEQLAERVQVTRQAVSRWGNRRNAAKYRYLKTVITSF